MTAAAPFLGTQRFEVRRELGSGGFGTVYQVWDREHAQMVALKHLHRSDPIALRRFKQEFRALANLAHTHLVSLFELHQHEGQWFFTMEFVDGTNFAEWVRPARPLLPEARGSSLLMTRPARPGAARAQSGVAAITPDARHPMYADTTPSDALADVVDIAPRAPPIAPTLASSPSSDDPPPPRASAALPASGADPESPPRGVLLRAMSSQPTPLDLAQPFHGIEIPDELALAAWQATLARGPGQGDADPERLRAAFRQLVLGLSWLHGSGHLHRDVKPSNVLVSPDGQVKVLDFGLVTRLFAVPHFAEALIGTPAYMAPELCAGLPASPASDWYSVGVMLYLALTGQLPFSGDLSSLVLAKQALAARPPSELNPVPRELEELCLALLSKNPVERPDVQGILEALGEKQHAASRGARHSQHLFVGRRAEVTLLASLLGGREERRDIALVEGLSGLGKTTLVEHVLRAMDERGDRIVLRSRCFERGSVRYRALDGAVDDLSQHLASLTDQEVERLLPTDPAERHALGRLFPALPLPARGHEATDVALPTDPAELKRRAFSGLTRLLVAVAQEQVRARPQGDARTPGVIIAIDDAQWADEDSLTPLSELLRASPPGLVRWVIAYRSDEVATSPFLETLVGEVLPPLAHRTARVELGPLSQAEALALAAERLGPSSGAQARTIASEADGNPLLIAELSRLGELVAERRVGVADLLAARVQELPVQARIALELVAVAGEPIPARLIRAATGADQRDLNQLVQDHLVAVRPSYAGEVVMSWHDRVRETVVRALSASDRTRRHRTLAETAEAQGGADAHFLHTHFREAGDAERARSHGARAVDAAMRAFAFDRAAEVLRQMIALDGANPAEHEALGDALRNAGRGVEAARAYLGAASRTSDAADERRLEILAAEQFLFAGAFGEGEAIIRKVLGRVGLSVAQSTPAAMATFGWESLRMKVRGMEFTRRDAASIPADRLALVDTLWSGTIGLSMASPLASQAFQQRHMRTALDVGEPFRVARALSIELAFSGLPGGNDERKSHALSRRAHAVARSLSDPYSEAFVTMSDGATHWLRGRWRAARASVEAALDVYERACTGVTWEKDTARFVALSALAHEGDFDELDRRYGVVLADAVERGDLYLEVQLRTRFGPLLELRQGRPEAARASIHRALGRWSASGYQIVHYWGFINRVHALLYEGDARGAWREVLAGTPPLKRSFMLMGQYYRVQFRELVGKAALAALRAASGGVAQALRREVKGAIADLEKEDMAWSRPLGKLLSGALHEDPRQLGEAALGLDAIDMCAHAAAARSLLSTLSGLPDPGPATWGAVAPDRFRRIYTGV